MAHPDIPTNVTVSVDRASDGTVSVTQLPALDLAAERAAVESKLATLAQEQQDALARTRVALDDEAQSIRQHLASIAQQVADATQAAGRVPLRHDSPLETVIAVIAHEANRLYAATLGDTSSLPWGSTDGATQASTVAGARAVIDGTAATPEQSHAAWMASKRAEGWTYGPEKNLQAKTHPNMVPWATLPVSEQTKDVLFLAIAKALLNR